MSEQELNDALERLRASTRRVIQRELRRSIRRSSRSPSHILIDSKADGAYPEMEEPQ